MVSSLNMGRRGESHPLSYLDMSECASLDDTGLQMVVISCPNLTHLYLRKCVNISGTNFLAKQKYSTGTMPLCARVQVTENAFKHTKV